MGRSPSSKKRVWVLVVGAAAVVCALVVAAFLFWPYFQDYDIARVDQSFAKIENNEDAVDELKAVSRLYDHVHASNSLHYYGTAYKALLQNPEPFFVLAERGSDQEKQFVAKVLSDGKKSYVEWYGVEKSGGIDSANEVLGKLSKNGATNTAILDAFRKGIAPDYP
jgi:hypothetical protein